MPAVWYNGILLQNARVLYCGRIPQDDGPTYCWTTFRTRIRGVYNPSMTSWNITGMGTTPFSTAGDPSSPMFPGNVTQNPTVMAITSSFSAVTSRAPLYVGPTAMEAGGAVPPGPASLLGAVAGMPLTTGPLTESTLRQHLMQKRQPLIIAYPTGLTAGGIGLLANAIAPSLVQDGEDLPYAVDAHNGPNPRSLEVVYGSGGRTMVVDWEVEFYLSEWDLFYQSQSISALVSHLWTMHHEIDQDAFTTRTIQGRAVFRTDRLNLLGADPDDYRHWLFHPCPQNCKRIDVNVNAADDGSALTYTLVDRETAFNIVWRDPTSQGSPFFPKTSTPVTRIECMYSNSVGRVGIEKNITDAVGAGGGMVGSGVSGAISGARMGSKFLPLQGLPFMGPILGGIAGGALGGLKGLGSMAATAVRNLTPKSRHVIVCRVWGNRDATRWQLAQCARDVIQERVGVFVQGFTGGSPSINLSQDLMGKFVEVVAEIEMGVVGPLLKQYGNPVWIAGTGIVFNGDGFSILATNMNLGNESIGGFAVGNQQNPIVTDSPIGNQPANNQLPYDNIPFIGPWAPQTQGCRGTFLEEVVAQALWNPYVQNAPTQPATDPVTNLGVNPLGNEGVPGFPWDGYAQPS